MKKICGKVLAVNISQAKGEKKNNIGCGLFIENLGLENDAHANPVSGRSVCWPRKVLKRSEQRAWM